MTNKSYINDKTRKGKSQIHFGLEDTLIGIHFGYQDNGSREKAEGMQFKPNINEKSSPGGGAAFLVLGFRKRGDRFLEHLP